MSTSVLFDAPGPRARARHRVFTVVGLLVIAAFVGFALMKLGEKGNLDAEKWKPFVTSGIWVDTLIPGLIGTLKAAGLAVVFAGVFGVVFGLGRLSQIAPIRWVSTVVVEFFRSVPVLIMMIAAFYFFAYNDIFSSDINPFAAVVTGLTLYNGSVVAELIRSGVGSLPAGQAEAGLSIGLSPSQTLRSIQLPQAITAMLPSLVSQLVVILKDTALGSIITYPELLTTYRELGSTYSNVVPAMIVIALLFILVNYTLTRVAAFVERRLRERGRTTISTGTGPAGLLPVDADAVTGVGLKADGSGQKDGS